MRTSFSGCVLSIVDIPMVAAVRSHHGRQFFLELTRTKVTGTSVFITTVPITKLFAWGEGDSGGHVL